MISVSKIFLALCVLCCSARTALVRAADDKMLELAKKEARVSFYTTMGADEAKMLADAFQSKYPSIRVEITRLGSEKLLQRIITESRAGSHLFDAVTNSGMEIYLLTKMGLLGALYDPGVFFIYGRFEGSRRSVGRSLFEPADDWLQYAASAKRKDPKTL